MGNPAVAPPTADLLGAQVNARIVTLSLAEMYASIF